MPTIKNNYKIIGNTIIFVSCILSFYVFYGAESKYKEIMEITFLFVGFCYFYFWIIASGYEFAKLFKDQIDKEE